MNEAFLHYIWQYQHFDRSNLKTTSGEAVSIFNPGMRNGDAGPDFFNGKIRIGDFDWNGNIEIHVQSSEWIAHRHHSDKAYENVILHVVWSEDQAIIRKDKSRLPTVELKGRVTDDLLLNYKKLINQSGRIPCGPFLPGVSPIKKVSMIERALIERLEQRADRVLEVARHYQLDWEQTTYHLLCRNFGFKINAPAFERLAEILPYRLLLKHADQLLQIEAMMFGQAGLLAELSVTGDYVRQLKREYELLSQKYKLADRAMSRTQWRFLRLRPANFPTIRIAQIASFLSGKKNLHSRLAHASGIDELKALFAVKQSAYWQNHYNFDVHANDSVPGLGVDSIFNIIVNTAVPVMIANGKMRDERERVDKALEILYQIPCEENAIVRSWASEGLSVRSAAESQGLIEMFNSYCTKKRCLDCSIGYELIQPPP